MPRTFIVTLAVLVGVGTSLSAGGCRERKGTVRQAGRQPLLIYVGTSMQKPMEECIAAYVRASGEAIDSSFGDSGEVLAQVKLRGVGDAALLHEPYMAEAVRDGWATNSYVIAAMTPVIVVPKGNPFGVTGLKDFARKFPDNRKVGLTDPNYTTSGQFIMEALKRAGIREQVLASGPVMNKSSGFIAMQVATKAIVAGTVWDAVAQQHAPDVDVVRIEPGLLPATFTDDHGVTYRDARVPVGLFELKTSKEPARLAKFVAFLRSEQSQAIWKANGFDVSILTAAPASAAE